MTSTESMSYALSYPALNREPVTQGHANYCHANGHAAYRYAGRVQPHCPRCGECTVKVSMIKIYVSKAGTTPTAESSR